MTPPQLTGDTPVTDVFHPVYIGFAEAIGDKLGLPFLHHSERFFCQRLHFNEPLCRDDGFDIIVTAIAGADIVGVILHLDQITLRIQIGNDGLSGIITVHTLILTAVAIDDTVIIQHSDNLEIMAQANLKVVGVVRGGHLHATGTEFHLGIIIGNNGNFLIHKG